MSKTMPRRRHPPAHCLAIAALLTCAGPCVCANDFEAGGIGAALAPVAHSRIRMLTERVTLTERGDAEGGGWQAEAVYVFHNPTAEPIATTFAFPEGCPESCTEEADPDGQDPSCNPRFEDLVTLVRGAPVSTRIGEGGAGPVPGLDLCIGRVHAFDIALAADERMEVRHRYRFSAGMGIGYQLVEYITRTGALWDGPIGSAEFVVVPRRMPHGISWPAGLALAGFEEQLGEGHRQVRYRFTAEDWTPTTDFEVALYDRLGSSEIPRMNRVELPCPKAWAEPQGSDDAPSPLGALSDAELALCRNLPYARHGYPFRRADLRAVYYRELPVLGNEQGELEYGMNRRFRIAAPNPFYSDALLDEDDRAYLAAIAAAQARHQGAKTGPR